MSEIMERIESLMDGSTPAEQDLPPAPEPEVDTQPQDAQPASIEPGEPAQEEPADTDTVNEGLTLSADEAAALSPMLEMLETYIKNGGAPAPIAAPDVPVSADPAQAQPQSYAQEAEIQGWEPLTEDEAEEIGILDVEAYNNREKRLALSAVTEFANHFMPEIRQLIDSAASRSEVVTLTHFMLKEHPELEDMTPQVRNEIERVRAANPTASPSKISELAYGTLQKHAAGLGALKRIRGIQTLGNGKPGAGAPSTARPVAQAKRPLTIQERIAALMNQ